MADTEMSVDPDTNVCERCIGDNVLKGEIRRIGVVAECAFCKQSEKCISLETIANKVNDFYRFHYVTGRAPGLSGNSQDGEFPETIVAELVDCDHIIADAIVEYLSAKENYFVHHDGAEPMFDKDTRYDRIVTDFPFVMHSTFEEFRSNILHVKRFYNHQASEKLHELLGDIDELDQYASSEVVRGLEPGKRDSAIFRARRALSPEKAKEILENLPGSLAPPPPEKARAGRMNAAGISVFYGGFSSDVCIAEIRPLIGSYIIVGEFEVITPVKLLDLTYFTEGEPNISNFDANYADVSMRWNFLRDFSNLISQPVLPDEESIEYVVTQVISEFINSELKFDGLIYKSAQHSSINQEVEKNVVLFGDDNSYPVRLLKNSELTQLVTGIRVKAEPRALNIDRDVTA